MIELSWSLSKFPGTWILLSIGISGLLYLLVWFDAKNKKGYKRPRKIKSNPFLGRTVWVWVKIGRIFFSLPWRLLVSSKLLSFHICEKAIWILNNCCYRNYSNLLSISYHIIYQGDVHLLFLAAAWKVISFIISFSMSHSKWHHSSYFF